MRLANEEDVKERLQLMTYNLNQKLTLDLKLRLVKLQLPLLVTQLFGQVFVLKAELDHQQ